MAKAKSNGNICVTGLTRFIPGKKWHEVEIDICWKCREEIEPSEDQAKKLYRMPMPVPVKEPEPHSFYGLQVDGKRVRDFYAFDTWTQENLEDLALAIAKLSRADIDKIIIIPGKLINLVKKAKP